MMMMMMIIIIINHDHHHHHHEGRGFETRRGKFFFNLSNLTGRTRASVY
jgi:hypothetical protein